MRFYLQIIIVFAVISIEGCFFEKNTPDTRSLKDFILLKTINNLLTDGGQVQPPADKTKAFRFLNVEPGSDGNVYFADTDSDSLKKWDMSTDTVSVVAAFDTYLSAMAPSKDNSMLYIAEGTRLWVYHCDSKVLEQKFNAPKHISSLYPAGNYLVCCIPDNSWNTNLLIRLSDFSQVDSYGMVELSRSSAYSPVNNRLYLLEMFYFDSENIWYQEIDTVNSKLGNDVTSRDGGDIPTAPPVKLFPDETRVATGSGTIFNTDDTLTYNGSLGYDFEDLFFGPDGNIYILNNYEGADGKTKCRLMKVMGNLPYLVIGIIDKFTAPGKRLIRDGNSLIVITQEQNNMIHMARYPLPSL
jgi:hypothetical protein